MVKLRNVCVGELTLACRTAGKSEQPALVLLHGWPHSSALFTGVMDVLAADHYVLAFDLPDVGESHGAPVCSDKRTLADLVLSAAEALGATSIVMAGLDVGGMIAFAAARDHAQRIRSAVVCNTVIPGIEPWSKVIADPSIWHFAFHNVPQLPEILVAGHQRRYFDFFFDFLAGDKRALTEELRDEFTRAYVRPESLSAGFEWYRAFAADARHNASFKKIEVPMLYLRGDADGRSIDDYVAGLRAAGVVNLRSATVTGSGEYLPVEAAAEFTRVLRDFW